MKEISIALVEDNQNDYQTSLNDINWYQKDKNVLINLDRFFSGEELLFEKKFYKKIILDINLGWINRIDLARKIREKDNLAVIIIVWGDSLICRFLDYFSYEFLR